jgi:hypothetical protein
MIKAFSFNRLGLWKKPGDLKPLPIEPSPICRLGEWIDLQD